MSCNYRELSFEILNNSLNQVNHDSDYRYVPKVDHQLYFIPSNLAYSLNYMLYDSSLSNFSLYPHGNSVSEMISLLSKRTHSQAFAHSLVFEFPINFSGQIISSNYTSSLEDDSVLPVSHTLSNGSYKYLSTYSTDPLFAYSPHVFYPISNLPGFPVSPPTQWFINSHVGSPMYPERVKASSSKFLLFRQLDETKLIGHADAPTPYLSLIPDKTVSIHLSVTESFLSSLSVIWNAPQNLYSICPSSCGTPCVPTATYDWTSTFDSYTVQTPPDQYHYFSSLCGLFNLGDTDHIFTTHYTDNPSSDTDCYLHLSRPLFYLFSPTSSAARTSVLYPFDSTTLDLDWPYVKTNYANAGYYPNNWFNQQPFFEDIQDLLTGYNQIKSLNLKDITENYLCFFPADIKHDVHPYKFNQPVIGNEVNKDVIMYKHTITYSCDIEVPSNFFDIPIACGFNGGYITPYLMEPEGFRNYEDTLAYRVNSHTGYDVLQTNLECNHAGCVDSKKTNYPFGSVSNVCSPVQQLVSEQFKLLTSEQPTLSINILVK